jgi:hypothetical protein
VSGSAGGAEVGPPIGGRIRSPDGVLAGDADCEAELDYVLVLRVVSCLTLRCLGRSGHGESSSATKE